MQSQDQLGWELYKASHDGNVERVTELLQEGAPVNWRNKDHFGFSALHTSCAINNRSEVVKVLLRYGPNVNQPKNDGYTPAHLACFWGSLDCLKLLLATGQCDLG